MGRLERAWGWGGQEGEMCSFKCSWEEGGTEKGPSELSRVVLPVEVLGQFVNGRVGVGF